MATCKFIINVLFVFVNTDTCRRFLHWPAEKI